MKTYKWIEFEQKEHPNPKNQEEYDTIETALVSLCSQCDFIVTNYQVMYPQESINGTHWGHRGPQLSLKDGGFTWWYNINGGWKLTSTT